MSFYQALAEFRYRIRGFLEFSQRAAAAAGLEPQQHQGLLALRGLPRGLQPTIRTLAERLCIRHHSAVELVNRLARAGLVTRNHAPGDARVVLLRLTPRGERLLDRLSRQHRAELRVAAPALVRALQSVIAKPPVRARRPVRRPAHAKDKR
ncbi:MAG TPA: MarR family winged helix-turn-helix transcriptional regulator [Terriglobales bacterium]|nr:MarR family winged helix-turn-helix transcriptional regulator [Terriglobales bacterium]